ncbi:MAG TPA: molybdopterin molybdotransferase MoeA [Allosphingosinicella sp.]|nr:molybdopterin molybdotransferase MoeA [Allosphingosinicella sp.]
MINFDEALALVAQAARPLGVESVTLAEAKRRVLAAPVIAMVDSPPADVSAMDGYAVRDSDLPGRLIVAGESFPGGGAGALGPGQCMRIFTGGPVPEGADRVAIQEEVTREGDIAIFGEPGPARHIRKRAGDFARGDALLAAGTMLGARALVAAAGADLARLDVWRRPRLVILGTGDELVEPGTARDRPGAIPESLSPGVTALAEDMGAEIVGRRRLRDDLPFMEEAAAEALAAADLVVVTGGASVGERDFAKAMFVPSGLELIFSKVAIKPGKPVWLGRVGDRLVIGLPGNPTSAMVTARLLLAPLIAGLGGGAADLRWRRAPLAGGIGASGDRETFVRAAWAGDSVRPFSNQDSSAQKTLADADLLIRRRAGAPAAPAGETVEIIDF